jgi:ABC-type phosphate transport system substrate-binding protein
MGETVRATFHGWPEASFFLWTIERNRNVRSTLVRRALQTAVVGGVLVGSMLSTVLPAHASVLPGGTVAVAAGGSDTTENFMKDYLTAKTTSTDGTNSYTVQTYNIPAFPTAPYTVDEDAKCPSGIAGAPTYTGTINWVQGTQDATPPHAPSGSGAGRNTLLAERSVGTGAQAVGCVDIARSSSKGGEAGLEYYGFAVDAVSWATTSLKAPTLLTRDQVKRIYNCSITDWAQVGGVPGPIQRYLPQSSSGTFQVFMTEFLDLPTSGAGLVAGQGGAGCPDAKQLDKNGNPFEENQGNTIANDDIDKAIMPYSGGVWAFQKNNFTNPTLDKRNGARIGGLVTNLHNANDDPTVAANKFDTAKPVITQNAERWNGTNAKYELDYVNTANPAGVVSDTNTVLANAAGFSKLSGFAGVRFLFNVVDSQNLQSYGPAVGLVGFDNTTTGTPSFKSPLCNGTSRTLILTYGFAPLPLTTSSFNQSTTAPSSCRKF